MATRFEILLRGEVASELRAAGEEAVREIHRIEETYSFYRKQSALSRLNALAGNEAVSVNAEMFSFLQKMAELSRMTNGAFDPAVGSLMKAWGFVDKTGIKPDEKNLRQILKQTGMRHVKLDKKNRTVRFAGSGVLIDPGAAGKGYAIDESALLLKELGVRHALIHGGTSSVRAWGNAPDGSGGWQIAVRYPGTEKNKEEKILKVICLQDEALSVSTVLGKTVEVNGKRMGHVIDPRSGYPVEGAHLAYCTGKSALTTDACSTAMLVLCKESESVISGIPGVSSIMVVLKNNEIIERIF